MAAKSDALVIFGISGDLAYRKIFPALQAMVRSNRLTVPVVGVSRTQWTTEQLAERVRKSLEEHGGVDPAAFPKLASDRKSTRLNSSHSAKSRMPSSA